MAVTVYQLYPCGFGEYQWRECHREYGVNTTEEYVERVLEQSPGLVRDEEVECDVDGRVHDQRGEVVAFRDQVGRILSLACVAESGR